MHRCIIRRVRSLQSSLSWLCRHVLNHETELLPRISLHSSFWLELECLKFSKVHCSPRATVLLCNPFAVPGIGNSSCRRLDTTSFAGNLFQKNLHTCKGLLLQWPMLTVSFARARQLRDTASDVAGQLKMLCDWLNFDA